VIFVIAAIFAVYYKLPGKHLEPDLTAIVSHSPTPMQTTSQVSHKTGQKPIPKKTWRLDKYIRKNIEKIKPTPKPKIPKEIEMKHVGNDSLQSRLKVLGAKNGDKVFVRIFKSERILELWIRPETQEQFLLLKTYHICNYSGALGPKLKEGDRQAPEGFYKVYKSSLNPHSRFTLSFNLGYPNRYDKAHGRTGSYLMVHGKCASTGCYAMGDDNIREIYPLVHDALYHGQKFVRVHIFPFRMEKLNNHAENKWYSFWQNLKEGYDMFDESHIPPRARLEDGEYVFE
jgi:murein L,D-transpeptidase YafK